MTHGARQSPETRHPCSRGSALGDFHPSFARTAVTPACGKASHPGEVFLGEVDEGSCSVFDGQSTRFFESHSESRVDEVEPPARVERVEALGVAAQPGRECTGEVIDRLEAHEARPAQGLAASGATDARVHLGEHQPQFATGVVLAFGAPGDDTRGRTVHRVVADQHLGRDARPRGEGVDVGDTELEAPAVVEDDLDTAMVFDDRERDVVVIGQPGEVVPVPVLGAGLGGPGEVVVGPLVDRPRTALDPNATRPTTSSRARATAARSSR